MIVMIVAFNKNVEEQTLTSLTFNHRVMNRRHTQMFICRPASSHPLILLIIIITTSPFAALISLGSGRRQAAFAWRLVGSFDFVIKAA